MAKHCGPFTFLCVFFLSLALVSLALASYQDTPTHDDVALARSMRSIIRDLDAPRGNERVIVDNGVIGNRRWGRRGNRGNRKNNGGGRRGRGRSRGRGRGRGGRRRRPAFSRRERRLIGRLTLASGQFSLQMYHALRQEHAELVFSPHSIHTALTMTYMGAQERTAKQMMKVLGLKRLRNDKAHMAYATLLNSLMTSAGNVTLNVANAVYVKPNLPVENRFRSRLQSFYRAVFDHFDMQAAGGPEAPINAWVANQTANQIQNLLAPRTIDDFTAMILINAIYFKGGWKDKFDAESTSDQPFYREDGSTTVVQMMTRSGQYNYTQSDELSAHIIELPYQDGRFSMYVILPVTRNAMSNVEGSLTLTLLNEQLLTMSSVRVDLHLPKFKSRSSLQLKNTLKSMGMRLAFSNRASFRGICSTQDLKITEVIHQAVVEVTEEGTEAAASTAVIIGLRSFPRPVTTVRADHPFIYAIRDNLSQAWLFMGKYAAQPSQ